GDCRRPDLSVARSPDSRGNAAGSDRQGVRLRLCGARRRLVRDAGVLRLADRPQRAARRVLRGVRLRDRDGVYGAAIAGAEAGRYTAYLMPLRSSMRSRAGQSLCAAGRPTRCSDLVAESAASCDMSCTLCMPPATASTWI